MDQPLELLKRVTGSRPRDLEGVTKWAYDEIVFRYQYGVGTETDLVMAAEWYCQAAAQGVWHYSLADKLEPKPTLLSAESIGAFAGSDEGSSMGLRAPDANGESEEFRRVRSVYLRAARSNPTALAEIGNRYRAGRGVPRSPINAWCWLSLAAQHGGAEARPVIAEIEAHIPGADLEQAKRSLPKLVQRLSEVSRTIGESSSERRP
jgi:hypothetical protein